jgi:hypothetical protein
VGDIYLYALRTAKLSLEKVHDVNRFLFSSSSSSSSSAPPPSSPEEVLLSFLKQRTGPTVAPSDSPPRGNGILSVFHLLEKIEREHAHQEKKEDLNQKHIRPSE